MDELWCVEADILLSYRYLCSTDIASGKSNKRYNELLLILKEQLYKEQLLLKKIDVAAIDSDEIKKKMELGDYFDKLVCSKMLSIITNSTIKNINEESFVNSGETYRKIMSEIRLNIDMFTIEFLRELIENEKDESLKQHLIVSFYDLCFMNSRLASLLLKESFAIKKEYFNSCYFVTDLLGADREKTQYYIDRYCIEMMNCEIKKIFYDKDYLDESSLELNYKLAQCKFNALAIMMCEEGFKNAKSSIINTIKEKELFGHKNYSYVIELLSDKNRLKKKFKVITFGKPLE